MCKPSHVLAVGQSEILADWPEQARQLPVAHREVERRLFAKRRPLLSDLDLTAFGP